MLDETIVTPSLPTHTPKPVVPALGAVVVALALTAGFFIVQAAERATALATAEAQTAAAQASVGRLRHQVRQLEQQLTVQRSELARALTNKMPVDVGFHVGEPGAGLVARFQNSSAESLVLAVEPRRPSTGEYARLEVTVPPLGSGELTEKQGWAFRSGDTLTVNAANFRPVALQVP